MGAPDLKSSLSLHDRYLILRYFIVVSLLTCPVIAFVYWRLGLERAAIAVACAIPFVAVTYLFWRQTHSMTFAGNWIVGVGYVLFLTVSLFTGGIESPALVWSMIVPVMGTLICGQRSGIFWFVLVLLKVGLFYMASRAGLSQRIPDPAVGQQALFLNMFCTVYFSFSIAILAEFIKERYLKRIQESNDQLQGALENIKTLKGLVPICAWCKKIRDDKGYWAQIETYIAQHTEAQFTHGLCPGCRDKLVQDAKSVGSAESSASSENP